MGLPSSRLARYGCHFRLVAVETGLDHAVVLYIHIAYKNSLGTTSTFCSGGFPVNTAHHRIPGKNKLAGTTQTRRRCEVNPERAEEGSFPVYLTCCWSLSNLPVLIGGAVVSNRYQISFSINLLARVLQPSAMKMAHRPTQLVNSVRTIGHSASSVKGVSHECHVQEQHPREALDVWALPPKHGAHGRRRRNRLVNFLQP